VRASHDNAHHLLARGDKVIVYPGGDLEAMRPYRKRGQIVFGGRTGYMQLALRAQVPIIPVVSAGAHEMLFILDERNWARTLPGLDRLLRMHVFPTTLSLPWGITPGVPLLYLPLPVKVLMEVLPPMRFERTGAAAAEDSGHVAACDQQVRQVMQAALDRLYRERQAAT
jgi:1-acyl-sn-glycerol-3-phosphate acyltransferase